MATSPATVAIPSVVLYELELGITQSNQPSKRRTQRDSLLSVIAVLPFDTSAAQRAAKINQVLRTAGTVIGPMDTLIAGIALAHGATLVTHNVREFRRVGNLNITDWY